MYSIWLLLCRFWGFAIVFSTCLFYEILFLCLLVVTNRESLFQTNCETYGIKRGNYVLLYSKFTRGYQGFQCLVYLCHFHSKWLEDPDSINSYCVLPSHIFRTKECSMPMGWQFEYFLLVFCLWAQSEQPALSYSLFYFHIN